MDRKKSKGGAGRVIATVLIAAVLVVGAGILLYPTIANFFNEVENAGLIENYEAEVDRSEEDRLAELMRAARAYNAAHTVNRIVDPFDEEADSEASREYENLLNPGGNGVMGYIVIPKISLELAVYHGVGADALEKGIGHIEGTSLPVGGENTHSVVSGHRGLPSAKLFTDLDQIEEGDKFYLTVLDETLAYEVDQILTVEPNRTEALAIEEGKDLVTLVTCTPYGVNSHRLLIRGHRIPYDKVEKEVKETVQKNNSSHKTMVVVIAAAAAVLVVLIIIIRALLKRAKRRRTETDGPAKEK